MTPFYDDAKMAVMGLSVDTRKKVTELLAEIESISDEEARALGQLMTVVAERGYLPDELVSAALQQYLETLGVDGLNESPARKFVDYFFSMHPRSASFLFYKGARKELEDVHREAIITLIMDRLRLELWPLPDIEDQAAPIEAGANQTERVFDDGDFNDVMRVFFGRERVYEESEDVLLELLARSRGALLAALESHHADEQTHQRFIEIYDDSYGSLLRKKLDRARSGQSERQLFWIGL